MSCPDCKEEDATPCCHFFICEAAKTDNDISLCIHCGGEMNKVNGSWYHWSQFENGILISPEHPQGEE